MPYKSNLLAAIHETMDGLHRAGAIDLQTIQSFDAKSFTPVKPPSQKDHRYSGTRKGQSGRLRELPQCHYQPHKPVGAQRETTVWSRAEAALFGREAWSSCCCLTTRLRPGSLQTPQSPDLNPPPYALRISASVSLPSP